jgi:Mor family transcriptional regulator
VKYTNGKDVLPPDLLEQVQQYVQGGLIYVPKREKAGWGTMNGTKKWMKKRNFDICRQYRQGTVITELMTRYHLSEESIRKIIRQTDGPTDGPTDEWRMKADECRQEAGEGKRT